MSKEKSKSSGVGFLSLLTLLFIGLKLGKVITWSWWLVLLPMYGWLAVVLFLLVVAGIVTLLDK